MAYPVTINGRTYTLADFTGLNYVDGFPDALEDFVTDAASKVTDAQTAQTAAETAQTAAETAQTGAETAKTGAETAQAAAEAAQQAIDGNYLGGQASDPTVDLNGDALTVGDWYFNTGTDSIKIYNGTSFIAITSFSTELADDTTPQLGGDLASNGSDILFADNDKAIFGAGSDLQIYHDGSDSVIDDNGTGSLKLQTGASTKLEIVSTGIDVTGTIVHDGLRNENTGVTATSKTLTDGENVTVTAATQTITLPASPAAGDEVHISVGDFTDTVVGRNSSNIMGLAEDLTLDVANIGVTLVYSGNATQGWRLF